MESLPTQATEPGHPAKRVGSAKEVPNAAGGRPTEPGNPQAIKAFTVAEIVSRIRQLIESQFQAAIWIEGELSNCSFPESGHIYFTLVDDAATDRFGQKLVLPCAFFKGANQGLKFKLADGQKVLCLGQITTYEGRAQYQLRVLRVEPRGMGALQLAFEQLKKKLQAEGLFDEARKRPIPSNPRRVGIVTSITGSAIHDMVSKLRDWFDVVILPVKVQGAGASLEIAQAVDWANRLKIADVLIVGRGGGSVEDLWAFNEEPVARSISRSGIPVISAVGHQDDWTIADYVADLRASTPTDAAKRLVHEKELFLQQARELIEALVEGMNRFFEDQEQRLDGLQGQLRLLHPLSQLERCLSRSTELQARLNAGMRYALDRGEKQLEGLAGRLQALSPLAVLARGYSITMQLPQHRVILDAHKLRVGDEVETLLARGRVKSQVTGIITENNNG